jgi:eukaryotic-like serine/threonine-protein kinase
MEEQIFGRSIGSYELLSRINRGSISELYKVRSHNTGEIFAMRKLLPHLVSDAEARASFLRGADIELMIDHPNVIKVFNIETNGSEPYIIVEYVEGDNLKQWILGKEINTLAKAMKVLCPLAEALNYIHGKNIIHHDIKPENVLISQKGGVKLTDFSLAVQKKKDYISSNRISGSPSYVAPEIIQYKKYDERVDIYSLGITAYELLSGQLPYSGKTPQETLLMHVSRFVRPLSLRRQNPEVTLKLETAVGMAMEKNRRKRYPHVSLFLRDLKEAARELRIEV